MRYCFATPSTRSAVVMREILWSGLVINKVGIN
jgi:hypothetical protein